jgi:Domain of unknown function (DUF4338)
MLTLHRAGHIELPAPRGQMINNAILHRRVREVAVVDQTPIEGSLTSLGPLTIRLVRRREGEDLFAHLLSRDHYLGYSRPVGEHLNLGRRPADRLPGLEFGALEIESARSVRGGAQGGLPT